MTDPRAEGEARSKPVRWKAQAIDAAATGLVIGTALLLIGLLSSHRDLEHAARLPVAIVVLNVLARLLIVWLMQVVRTRR